MPTTYVGSAVGTTTATLPAHQAGDIIVAFAFNRTSNLIPTLGASFTNLGTNTTASTAVRYAYILATGSGTSPGAWSPATSIVFQIYRPAPGGSVLSIGQTQSTTGNSVSHNYPATVVAANGTSWVSTYCGDSNTTTLASSTPAGLTNRADTSVSTSQLVGNDTNGGVTSFPTASFTTATAGQWISASIVINTTELDTISGTLAKTEDADTISATSQAFIKAVSTTSEQDDFNSVSTLSIEGFLSAIESNDTISSTTKIKISSVANIFDDNDTIVSAAFLPLKAALSNVETSDTISSRGSLGTVVWVSSDPLLIFEGTVIATSSPFVSTSGFLMKMSLGSSFVTAWLKDEQTTASWNANLVSTKKWTANPQAAVDWTVVNLNGITDA